MVGFEETDQEAVGVSAPDADDLSAVVDRFGEALDRNGAGLFFEAEGVEGGIWWERSLQWLATCSACAVRSGNRSIVRFGESSAEGFGAAELRGVVRIEEENQKLVREAAFEADELSAVEDRFWDALIQGDASGFVFEVKPVLFLDGCEGLAIGLGDPQGVVVEFAGDAGLGGGDPDDPVGSVGFEEGLLFCGEGLRHHVVPVGDADPSVHDGFARTASPENGSSVRVADRRTWHVRRQAALQLSDSSL
jgi:hypothetical protein